MKYTVLFYATLFFSLNALCQPGNKLTAAMKLTLDSLATQDVPPNAPGVAVGIVQNGRIVYSKYAGFANLIDSALITSDTRFNIASNAKQFTALAVLKLASEAKLRLSDDIRQYFPELFPSIRERITIAHLLSHTSGIRDVYDLWSLQDITWWKNTFNNDDVLRLLTKQQELNFKPGSRNLYSNSNYLLLAELVSKVSGTSFINYTRQLFDALGMPNTSFEPDYRNTRKPIAAPYFNFETWTGYNWIWNAYGDGNLFTTLADQLQWETILQRGTSKALSKSLLIKSQARVEGFESVPYGYGLEFGKHKNINYTFHEGATGAWKATVLRFPSKHFSIVTMCNTGKAIPAFQSRQMADLLLGISKSKEIFQAGPGTSDLFFAYDDLPGIYQDEQNFTFQIEKRDTSLYLLRQGRNDTRLVRESGNVFHQWNDKAFKQAFAKNAVGEMEVTAYYTTHAPYTLRRENIDWSTFDSTALDGDYSNSELQVALQLKRTAGKKYAVQLGSQVRNGFLVNPKKMIVDNYTLRFTREDSIATIFLDGERIKNVKFVRR